MSKTYRLFLFICGVLWLTSSVHAQGVDATVVVGEHQTSVTGRFAEEHKSLSFLLERGGINELGERITSIRLTDKEGKAVAHRRMIAGEFLAERPFAGWSYSIDLALVARPIGVGAHVSWIAPQGGVLMLDDLLPIAEQGKTGGSITLSLPKGWSVYTTEQRAGDSAFVVLDLNNAVFHVGPSVRVTELQAGSSRLRIAVTGSWLFTDQEAAGMAGSVYEGYVRQFGGAPAKDVLIAINRFPTETAMGNWEADTRGSTVTIASSDMPFKSQSVQRLHEQLRHELFHLWIPNGVALTGNYDWFYEGFALYSSLKMAIASNRIRFEDMLDTLSRAYSIDNRAGERISLIDASKRRWTGSNTDVYARGMLVAFLCDLALLERSGGKRSVTDIVREVYVRHRPPAASSDGNAAVLAILKSHPELVPITTSYIEGRERILWEPLLKAAGLEPGSGGSQGLRVVAKPSGRQKDLLNKLGYNNWRKLSQKQ